MWELMVLAFKVGVGAFLWVMVFALLCFIVGLGFYARVRYQESKEPQSPKRPPYKGQKIVIDGGKKKDG